MSASLQVPTWVAVALQATSTWSRSIGTVNSALQEKRIESCSTQRFWTPRPRDDLRYARMNGYGNLSWLMSHEVTRWAWWSNRRIGGACTVAHVAAVAVSCSCLCLLTWLVASATSKGSREGLKARGSRGPGSHCASGSLKSNKLLIPLPNI